MSKPHQYWCRRRRYPTGSCRKHRTEIEIIAECTRTDVIESRLGKKDGGRRQSYDRHALAITDRLRADGLARVAIDDADQLWGGDERYPVAPGRKPFILEFELDRLLAIRVKPLNGDATAKESFCGPALDGRYLSSEEPRSAFGSQDRLDRVLVSAPRHLDGLTKADSLRGGALNGPLLHLGSGSRRLASHSDRSEFCTELPACPLHPL